MPNKQGGSIKHGGWVEKLNWGGELEKYEFFTRRRHIKGKKCIHYIRHTVIAISFEMAGVLSKLLFTGIYLVTAIRKNKSTW